VSLPVTAYLALGSNVGDRMANLRQAITFLGGSPGISVERVAGIYETEPVGVRDQPWFLNTAVRVSTELSPQGLLAAAKQVEATVGRTATYRWGPREIDVDVLLYGDVKLAEPTLTIPHPRMAERLFVLLPLRDLFPDWRDVGGTAVAVLIERLQGSAEVRRYPEEIAV
jgi:2-amino-4-hydroxy-6-hydroxymethyldihydropteridine diphosphokinase